VFLPPELEEGRSQLENQETQECRGVRQIVFFEQSLHSTWLHSERHIYQPQRCHEQQHQHQHHQTLRSRYLKLHFGNGDRKGKGKGK